MLRELKHTRQIAGESKRRWFTSDDMDLIVWFDEQEQPLNFELCYNKLTREKALRWSAASGFTHWLVDSGENLPGRHKASPVYFAADTLGTSTLKAQFMHEGAHLPPVVRDFVLKTLQSFS